MSSKRGISKNKSNGFHAVVAAILLIIFVAGSVPISLIHQFIHAHTRIAHTIEQEKDPCHKAIYHAGKDNGCRHEFHVIKIEKCNLCDFTFNKDQVLIDSSYQLTAKSYFFCNDRTVYTDVQDVVIHLSPRAPPFHSSLV